MVLYQKFWVIAVGCLLSGCSLFPITPTQDTAFSSAEYVRHTVRYRGETFGIISLWYTGSPAHWRAIHRHNPGLSVRHIQINDTIRIPKRLAIRKASFKKGQLGRMKLLMGQASAKPLHVNQISGCEHLSHSFDGLVLCAEQKQEEVKQYIH